MARSVVHLLTQNAQQPQQQQQHHQQQHQHYFNRVVGIY